MGVEKGSFDWTNWNWIFSRACEGGNIDCIDLIKDYPQIDWNWGLENACNYGHIHVAKFLIEKGPFDKMDWNRGLNGAFQGLVDIPQDSDACQNYRDCINLMLEKGANDLYDGLWRACCDGNIYVVELIMEKASSNLSLLKNVDWNWSLECACRAKCHISIIDTLIKKGANIDILKLKHFQRIYKRYQIYKILSQIEDDWIVFVMDFI